MECYKYGLIASALILSTGCATWQNIRTQEIDHRKVEFVSDGAGQPIVVFETGMGATIDTWKPIFDQVSSVAQAFVYNRPGYRGSSNNHAPQGASEIAKQLRHNLKSTGHQPPYVLVGHSAGGLYVNMYARLYPEEVAGVVLLDSSHPEQFQYFKEEKEFLYNMLISSTSKGRKSYETNIVMGVHKDFNQAPPFPQVPLIVLTSGRRSSIFEGPDMRAKWLAFQKELAAMSANSTHTIVEGSGHFVHKDKPEVVINAIKQLVEQSKQKYSEEVY